jgi:hydrogenase maturation protein HypF
MADSESVEIRVRGRVQGVGFRPMVYRIARELGLAGQVSNDAEGVLIRAAGAKEALTSFLTRLVTECPPLGRVDAVERAPTMPLVERDFRIVESRSGTARTEVAPDAASCADCAREVLSPGERRYRYPFTTCTHCGPRLTIVRGIPYDRASTTMLAFPLCAACDQEYRNPDDRRFHAEAMACPMCGPKAELERFDDGHGERVATDRDALSATRSLLERGCIVAIKGLGGYHLACDATRADVVERLRARKNRDAKPFALMARDLDVIRRYCELLPEEERVLTSPAGPVVLLKQRTPAVLPDSIAPGHRTLGFLLPTTPLHLLLLDGADTPLVMTSGNVSGAPPVIDEEEARERLAGIADYSLSHDRRIANRVDDSVVRIMHGRARLLRRSRGYAPASLELPTGFHRAPPLLAYGGDLKGAFCLLSDGRAVLSQHQGDLEERDTLDDFEKNVALYASLFEHRPGAIVADLHPDYAATRMARAHATRAGADFVRVQHHHAHVAACLAENAWPLEGSRVLGVVLDGLGLGEDGELWGGEFLLADYRSATRLASLSPVALVGGDRASREPWRNLYAHLMATMDLSELATTYGELDVVRRLAGKPLKVLERLLATGLNAPRASSCGRLFDAVAAAVEVAFDRQAYEGQAGALLEGLVAESAVPAHDVPPSEHAEGYPFALDALDERRLRRLNPAPMWRALLADLAERTPVSSVAARFHGGLARAVTAMVVELRGGHPGFDTVVLSGGCFQNRVLFEATVSGLESAGFTVLTHAAVPPNDGGLALGQAVIAAARSVARVGDRAVD